MDNISQNFQVQIIRFEGDTAVTVAKDLAAAIITWEREIDDDEEDEDDKDDGFLVPDHVTLDAADEIEVEDSEEEPEDEDSDEDDSDEDSDADEDEDDESQSKKSKGEDVTGTLYLTTTVNKGVLADLRDIQDSNEMHRIRFTYGNSTVGSITREFTVYPDLFVSMTEGNRNGFPEEQPLEVTVSFDVNDSDIIY